MGTAIPTWHTLRREDSVWARIRNEWRPGVVVKLAIRRGDRVGVMVGGQVIRLPMDELRFRTSSQSEAPAGL